MEAINILHMISGDGESSYARNSFLQETIIQKTLPVLKHTIKGIANLDAQCLKIADFGCSSSPNTLLLASNIIHIVDEVCKEKNHKSPQFQVCLNDLFENDFNTLFKLLPMFYAKLTKEKGENFGPCFVSAVPGSFYGRLFPDESLHLVHSSSSLHWLSQVPEGIENNTTNIYISKTSPPNVFEAYQKQFHTDFTRFLRMRSWEIVHGGHMVLTFYGRSIVDPTSDDCCSLSDLMALSLLDVLKEGLIQQSDIDSFNIPYYTPCEDEVRNIIQNEGSFCLETLNVFQVNWDPYDTDYMNTKVDIELSRVHGENTAKNARAVSEPFLASRFGNSIVNLVYKKLELHVAEHQAKKKTRHFNFVLSLSKK